MHTIIGERERANLVVQLARFFYISICRLCSCRLPVLSDLLVWFSTHCTDANRRETMPKQHYITCPAQCVPTLTLYSAYTTCTAIIKFLLNSSIIFCRTLVGSLPLANNVQHSASRIPKATTVTIRHLQC